jgi:hypothetical protein
VTHLAVAVVLAVVLAGCATDAEKAERQLITLALLDGLGPAERLQLCDQLIHQLGGDCSTAPRSALAYSFRRPVIGVDARPVLVTEADWDACDERSHRWALQPQQSTYDTWMSTGTTGYPLSVPNPYAYTTLDQRYEMSMRSCLVRKGYTMVPSWESSSRSFRDHKKD